MSISLGIPRILTAHGAPTTGGLVDTFGRQATDMRLSLTDKCNLRCTYCMPAEGMDWLSRNDLMTADEIVRLVDIGVDVLQVRELRLTGGEPLVRKDLEEILRRVRASQPELPISLTTNAVGLDRRAASLRAAGLTRLNVSLDSLHSETFAALTRRPFLERVLRGIDAAADAGLGPIKINAVLLRGINDHEAADLVDWAIGKGYELRFIEQMPLDEDHIWTRDNMITAGAIRARVEERFVLTPDPRDRDGAPADRWEVRRPGTLATEPADGVIGIIASVTEPFCADCRRTRITADGKVRSCLFSHDEVPLLHLMRSGATDAEIAQRWRDAMWMKPKAHGMDHAGLGAADYIQPERSMSAIGG
ncbi:GTP 3',8-cyclase MoaA [Naasia lichenicola]|uniref:GTP 3',8-cyclase n=1 Tax=Naasia lichenicola TaxID=2565933 RepID=A0A4V3WSN2_9MICO|nr:GTP 3',8-cyclase MoaA [Naasia lichenicola]THG28717.1 GTP 3',8-cyclase MoaA [Naasia lichenicola]